MNRKERRKTQILLRKHADATAKLMAQHVYDYDHMGRKIHIVDPRAVSLLERAYRDYFLSDSSIIYRELSPKDACRFPRPSPHAATAVNVMAITEDPDGALVFCIEACHEPFLSQSQRLAVAKEAAREKIMLHSRFSGFTSKP